MYGNKTISKITVPNQVSKMHCATMISPQEITQPSGR